MDISQDELFKKVIAGNKPKPAKSIPFALDNASLSELFEFLLDFFTDLCKHFNGDEKGQVNINTMSSYDLQLLNQYMESMGFSVIFTQQQATFANCQYYSQYRYDKIPITPTTQLIELFFAIKCEQTLNVIQFRAV